MQFSSEIVVAGLAFLGTLIGSWGGIRLMSYRIEQLELKVDKHNHLVERMYKVEKEITVLEERMEVL